MIYGCSFVGIKLEQWEWEGSKRESVWDRNGERKSGVGENREQDQSASHILKAKEWIAEESLRALCLVRCWSRSHSLLQPWQALRVWQHRVLYYYYIYIYIYVHFLWLFRPQNLLDIYEFGFLIFLIFLNI